MFIENFTKYDSEITTKWYSLTSDIRICSFSFHDSDALYPISFHIEHSTDHTEILFCNNGVAIVGMMQGVPITISRHEILVISDTSYVKSLQITSPLEGILVDISAVPEISDVPVASSIFPDFPVLRMKLDHFMKDSHGILPLHDSAWVHALFETADFLTEEERFDYYGIKTLEILYLMCTKLYRNSRENNTMQDSYLVKTIADMKTYMEDHLDEKVTINFLSKHFHISSTTFKNTFRRIYGFSVHQWLLETRMKRAAELLCHTPMTILQISQAVGYEGVSQFNVIFKRHYGITPRQYRKISNTGDI